MQLPPAHDSGSLFLGDTVAAISRIVWIAP
jgi:hypothetical protein